ncbi:MAG: enolase C-terminal domain-like protein [Betaproteobacteria bacterium]
MNAPATVKVLAIDLFEQPFRLRLPFRFGAVTVTHGLQAIARVRLRCDGSREGIGYAAEALGAKWFDKDPTLSDEQNQHQLRKAIEIAAEAYLAAPPLTPFDLHAGHHAAQLEAGAQLGLPSLVASFGPALLDRAVLDAVCQVRAQSFWQAMQANVCGMRSHAIAPDLVGLDFDALLRELRPALRVHARHTVGLLDPIDAADQAPGTRVEDGLPETLQEVVEAYGNRYFKLKVSGRLDADLQRLRRIAAVLGRIAEPINLTLDGHEQYEDAASITALWQAIEREPALARLAASTLFIEQPIKRQAALAQSVATLARHRPVIIDESDGDLEAFPRARALGYTGVSSKACKGFYKSVLNLVRCRLWTAQGGPRYFMSGEDLTTQAGTSMQQDLALASLLGIAHVERNAHHFIDGFGARPSTEARAFLQAHPDLYHEQDGRVRLRIERGELALGSLQCSGFGSAVEPELSHTPRMPRAEWPTSPETR